MPMSWVTMTMRLCIRCLWTRESTAASKMCLSGSVTSRQSSTNQEIAGSTPAVVTELAALETSLVFIFTSKQEGSLKCRKFHGCRLHLDLGHVECFAVF